MARKLKYPYVQGDTEVDILQKNKENIIELTENGTGSILVDDSSLIALQNDTL